MAELSGVDTSYITQVNGFFTTQGGRSIGAGTYMFGDSVNTWVYNLVDVDSELGPEQYALTSSTAHTFDKVVSNYYFNFWALKGDGTLWMLNRSTSYNSYGTQTEWTQYGTDTDWEDIAGGRFEFAAIKNGEYYHLGYNYYQQAGNGTSTNTTSWTKVGTETNWVRVERGENFTIIMNDLGEVYVAGRNASYRTGRGTTSGNTSTLTQLTAISNAIDIQAGFDGGGAITEATAGDGYGSLYVWGYNNGNSLGKSGSTTTPVITTIAGGGTLDDVVSVGFGRYASHVVTDNGYLYRAGYANNNVQWDEIGSKTSGWDRDGTYTGFTKVYGPGARSGYGAAFVKDGKTYVTGHTAGTITENELLLEGKDRTAIEDLSMFDGLTVNSVVPVEGQNSNMILVSVS
jgi:hypothetical protein